jgi:hypothetical protein
MLFKNSEKRNAFKVGKYFQQKNIDPENYYGGQHYALGG